jgi:hypothetical protein
MLLCNSSFIVKITTQIALCSVTIIILDQNGKNMLSQSFNPTFCTGTFIPLFGSSSNSLRKNAEQFELIMKIEL